MKTNLKEYVNDVLSSQSLKNRMMFDNNGLKLRELDQRNKIDVLILCLQLYVWKHGFKFFR